MLSGDPKCLLALAHAQELRGVSHDVRVLELCRQLVEPPPRDARASLKMTPESLKWNLAAIRIEYDRIMIE